MTANQPTVETFRAACIQFDVRSGDVAANCAAMRAGIEEAAAAGAALCVLPELWSTSFLSTFDDATIAAAEAADRELQELTATHDLIAVGSAIEADAGRIYNTATVFDRGESLGSYRKIHLFSPNLEPRRHAAGNEPKVFATRLGRLGILICYDLRFPELARYYFHKGVQLLLVPGQWPEARAQHWRTLLRARAIENEVFVLGSNRTGQEPSPKSQELQSFPGDGRIVDPTGEILVAGAGDSGALVAEIELRKVRTMQRILPVHRDQRPSVYRRLFDDAWPEMLANAGEGVDPADEGAG
ncbi:MAG: carbon-nitrogen family hydrolase [Planctomycetes bacterium]|nr:carbon-nitrogen family hydrolase [Planctomycetota bacterium]